MSDAEAAKLVRERLRSVVILRDPEGIGSGFYAGTPGMIVTNAHVVGRQSSVTVERPDRTKGAARVVRVARSYDLALLLDPAADPPPPLPLADPSVIAPGETVYAIGHPVGLEFTVTRGVVSARDRLVRGAYHLQTDAVVHPGSSGGPLLDGQGAVVGVSTFVLDKGGLNFALSIRYVHELLGELMVRPPPTSRACPACGAKNSAARRSCRKCGGAIDRPRGPAGELAEALRALDPPPEELTVDGDALTCAWRGRRLTLRRAAGRLTVSCAVDDSLAVVASGPADGDIPALVRRAVEARERLD